MTRRAPAPDPIATLRSRVRRTLARSGALPAGCHAVVAASGGRDSTALLDVLAALAPALDLGLTVLHVDHGLRPEGPAERDHVAALAAARGLPFVARAVTVPRRADGGASEAALRAARRAAFAAVAAAVGADRVATGHTADDQAETLLLRLGRGTGPRGLSGMRPVERAEGGLLLVRPLLAERRAAVAAYAAARGLAWCEDPTNDAAHPAGAAWLRNRVRHTLLPAWTALFGDGGVARLAELAALLGDERDLTAALLAAHEGTWWRRLPDADPRAAPAGVALDATALARQPAALRRHALVHALDLLGRRTGFTRRHVDALAALAGSTAGSAALDLPGGLAARRAYGALVLSRTAGRPVGGDGAPHAGASAPVTPDGALSAVDRTALVVPGPGRYTLGAAALHVRRDPAAPGGRPDPTREAWFAATPEAFPLRLRPPRRGERLALALAAGVGHRPVARVLVDRKVPRAQRGAALLLVDGADAPLWLLLSGGRPADPEPAAGSGPGPGGGDVATPGASGMSALPERFAPTQGLLRTALRPVRPGVGPVVRVSLTPPA